MCYVLIYIAFAMPCGAAVTIERARLKNHKPDLIASIAVDTQEKFTHACALLRDHTCMKPVKMLI